MIELGITRCTKHLCNCKFYRVNVMHNLISFNQLAGLKNMKMSEESNDAELINDYYNCLIECEDDQPSCKRICKEILL